MATSFANRASMSKSPSAELEEAIKLALKKTGVTKEFDLCDFLSSEGRLISPSIYLRLRDTDQATLLSLIWKQILNRDVHKPAHKAEESSAHPLYAGKSLEECIKEAMSKLNISRETALCKYIPCEVGYLHHFTFLKMKSSNPIQLRNLIKEHILDQNPKLVPPKKRKRSKYSGLGAENLRSQSVPNEDNKKILLEHQKLLDAESCQQNHFKEMLDSGEKGEFNILLGALKDQTIGQLLNILEQLSQTLQYQNHRDGLRHENLHAINCIKCAKNYSTRYLQVIQSQLIDKIRSGRLDEELWQIYKELLLE